MNLNLKKNKLKYQAFYRGCRENELLFRSFFEKHFDDFDDEEIVLFEDCLKIDDGELLDYLYNRKDFEESEIYKTNRVFKMFINFCLRK